METGYREGISRFATAVVTCFAVAIAVAALPAAGQAAEQLPNGFSAEDVANVDQATAFAFVPDGRILITSQLGRLYVHRAGEVTPTLALDLTGVLCDNLERGLLGVAVDPAFADQHYIYLYYTYKRNGNCGTDQFDASTQPVNRVSRFLLGDDDHVDPASEQVLIDSIPSPAGIHNAGDIQFGKDGYLYATVGDGGCYYLGGQCGPWNMAARDQNVLLGKVLRIASDGSIPANNPFTGTGSSRCNVTGRTVSGDWCQEIYATGLRNPFRLAFDPAALGTRFYINDVGQDNWEEVDLGQPGADYGWSVREGPCAAGSSTDCGPAPTGMNDPVYSYDHSAGCSSITGGAFVPPGVWPAAYDGHYLYSDIVCQKIFDLAPGASTASAVFTGVPEPLGPRFGPYGSTQALYYISYYPGSLRRIEYTGSANRSPHASATASPTYGAVPLTVDFDARGSSDPDDNPLTFDWDFGDGTAHESTAQVSHIYTSAGVHTASVTVTDGNGGSDTTTVRIDTGNNAPIPQIVSPASGQLFSVGEAITLTGSASDPDEGSLSDSALTWEVIKHHATHTHPFLPPTTGNGIQITGPVPEDFSAITNSYLEVRLTATDSQGLSTTISRDLRPKLVTLGFASLSAGLQLVVNGTAAPSSLTSWAGWKLQVDAPNQTDANGQGETFVGWSDHGAQSHLITTPDFDTTYTASFTHVYVRPRAATPLHVALVPAYRMCRQPDSTHGAPLAVGSCSAPEQASDYATVGTPDANGLAARSTGFVNLRSVVGNSNTEENEADVKMNASISDVLDRTRGLSPYLGELYASLPVRVTDRRNGSSGTDAATVRDFKLNVPLPCSVDSVIGGSTCAAATTMNTLIPGLVIESQRTVWQLDGVRVLDGGPDGVMSTTPNTLFATQGLFLP
jgi:glucose/arabinose dehydrogenase/PKD repeat protein